MTKPGGSPTTKKTLHELAKEFPEKTYRELEKYRDADRQEEAEKIPLTESQQKQEELEPIEDALGACITAGMKRDKAATELQVMKRRAQEAQARSNQLQDELDRAKKENNDLFTRIAELIEANEKEVKNLKWIKDHDYIFLVDENKKLHKEVRELKEDNKRLASEVEDWIDKMRKSGV